MMLSFQKGARTAVGRVMAEKLLHTSSRQLSPLLAVRNNRCPSAITQRCYHLSSVTKSAAVAQAPENSTQAATDKAAVDDKKSKKEDKPNLFLDNLGTIFLTAIGLLIASLVRSFMASSRKNALRDKLEAEASLDPLEIDELRRVNPTLTVSVFRSLLQELWNKCPEGQITYPEFTKIVRKSLVQQHNVPTVEFGHLLDRVALHIMESKHISPYTPQPTSLWMTVLSLALSAPTPDRIRVLYEILQQESDAQTSSSSFDSEDESSSSSSSLSSANVVVNLKQVRQLVEYLQMTDQLVIDTQLIPTKDKAFPIQQHHRGTPEELVQWEGSETDVIDVDALTAILRSRSVCAWGECYRKKKFT